MARNPAKAFVDKPYVIGSTRTETIDIVERDANTATKPADLTNDRIEILIKRSFDDPDEDQVARYRSDGNGIAKGRRARISLLAREEPGRGQRDQRAGLD